MRRALTPNYRGLPTPEWKYTLVLNDGNRRHNVPPWKGGASAPPPPAARRGGPLGPEATLPQGLKPPMISRFPWRG